MAVNLGAHDVEGADAPPAPGGVEALVDRLAEVRARIAAAGRSPEEIRVVAVTKGFGPAAVEAVRRAGIADVGENYAQELATKFEAAGGAQGGLRWHFLGRVQRNKVASIAGAVALWQGVDRVAAGVEIARRAPGARVLVQVRLEGGGDRNGCAPTEVPALVDELGSLGLSVRGLMAVGPPGPPEAARSGFRSVVALADRLHLPERSLGMTGDLHVAVEEGSTMVRVGRGLFGTRPGGPHPQR